MRSLELRIPPVVIFAASAMLMAVVDYWLPVADVWLPGRPFLAAALLLVSLYLVWSALSRFRSSQTTVNPHTPQRASSLVVTGVYRFTRNPMYLGLLLVLIGWGLYLSNGAALLLLPLFVLYMNKYQIGPEERVLASKFGEEYIAYKTAVRRWL